MHFCADKWGWWYSQIMCLSAGPTHQVSGTVLGSCRIEIHFPKRRRKRTKEKKTKSGKRNAWVRFEEEGCGEGAAWQCACCGEKDTRHKFGGSFAAPVVWFRELVREMMWVWTLIDCKSCAVLFLISHNLWALKLYPVGTWIGWCK